MGRAIKFMRASVAWWSEIRRMANAVLVRWWMLIGAAVMHQVAHVRPSSAASRLDRRRRASRWNSKDIFAAVVNLSATMG